MHLFTWPYNVELNITEQAKQFVRFPRWFKVWETEDYNHNPTTIKLRW